VTLPRSNRRHPGTPRAAGLAGFALLGAWLLGAPLVGCAGDDAPRVRVVNESGRRLNAIWVRTQHDSVRVPSLAPGDSVEVRPRVRGEDLLWVTGRFRGRRIDSHGGDYVEGSGGYRFRAVIDSAGRADVQFLRMGLW